MNPATRRGGSLIDRMIGVASLNEPTFNDIEHDTNATPQALIVVVIAAIAAAIGALGEHQGSLIGQTVMAVVNWIVFSVVAYFVGSMLFHGSADATIGKVLRLVGFAQTPKILGALAFIPLLGWIAGLVAAIWFLVVSIYALRAAFNFQLDRAVLTAIVSLVVMVAVSVVVGLLFNVTGGLLNWIF